LQLAPAFFPIEQFRESRRIRIRRRNLIAAMISRTNSRLSIVAHFNSSGLARHRVPVRAMRAPLL
jgi:hypothetical protein